MDPLSTKALPMVPPKVRTKIASKIGGKGLAKFVPFLNTIIAIPDVISAISKGDAEGALLLQQVLYQLLVGVLWHWISIGMLTPKDMHKISEGA